MRQIGLAIWLLLVVAAMAAADTVRGVVLSPDGQPVAGAEVVAEPVPFVGSNAYVTATTDATGTFALELARDPGIRLYGRVTAFAPGYSVGGAILREAQTTVTLWPAGQAWGSVVDGAGQPVAGAHVVATHVSGPGGDRRSGFLILEPVQPRVSAVTSADGRFVIQNLPTSGNAMVRLEDPRFPHEQTTIDLNPGAPPAAPLVARAGAVIAGRVVLSGGQPAPGVRVFAQGLGESEGWGDTTSGADGSYQLSSLSAGSYNVMADDPSGKWVAAALQGIGVQAGETVTAPDLVLTAGALVDGRVTDAQTGRGIAGVRVGSYGPHRPRTTAAIIGAATGATGQFRLRVVPGESYVYISGAPPEYFRLEENTTVTLAPGAVRQVGFTLSRGVVLSGTASDERGRPATGAAFSVSSASEEGPSSPFGNQAVIDPEGSFSISPLAAGTYTLQGQREWQVVQPTEVTLPASGPVRVTLRKVALLRLAGRVVTPNGTPVAGAMVRVQMYIRAGGGMCGEGGPQLTTDAQGRYTLEEIDPNVEGLKASAEAEGYLYASGGVVTRREGGLAVSDVVLSPLNSSVEGRVVSVDGQPVAGAQVLVPEGSARQAISDPTGHFFLSGAPGGEVHVVAARGREFGEARVVAPNAQVGITLRPVTPLKGSDVLRGFAILSDVLTQSQGKDYYARESLGPTLAPYDPDLALKLAQGSQSEWGVASIIGMLAEIDPARAVAWAPAHLKGIEAPTQRGVAAAQLALVAATRDPELAKRVYTIAKEALAKSGNDIGGLMGRGLLVAAAGRLQDPEAEGLLGQLITDVKAASKGGEDRGLLEAVIEGAAKGSPALAERAMELADLNDRQRISATARAIESLCDYAPVAARTLLDTMKPDGDELAGHYYGVAAKRVIVALGKTDPAGALAVAKTVSEPGQRAQALALAAQLQGPELAASVLREAQQAAAGNAGTMAWIASLARVRNEALGAELFAAARKAAGDSFGPEFAFYWAQVNPAEARMRLEVVFATRKPDAQPAGHFFDQVPAVLAMSAVDVDRALELARSIPEVDANAHCDAQRKIAQYVLASEEVRRTMAFNRWCASDTWIPGTPTGW